MRRKALIITYYWPPAGGSGVQRWVKFAKYLRDFNWEPIIYTPSNPEHPATDKSLLKDLPNDITVIRKPIWEPYRWYKKFIGMSEDSGLGAGLASETKSNSFKQRIALWIRGNFFIPDARKFWIKPSSEFLKNHLSKNPVDVIVSTGPPHSMHLIAKKTAASTGIPWLADFRDPWTNIDFVEELNLSLWAKKLHARKERQVLQKADAVVAVTPTMAKELDETAGRKVHVITNGFDPEDFEKNDITTDDFFSVLHIGTMNKARNPEMLWKVLQELTREHPSFAESLKLRLVGKVDASVRDLVKQFSLEQYVDIVDYIPHNEIVKEQQRAQVLLLIVNQSPNAYLLYQGKLFEYLASGRPILTIGPEEGDTRTLLKELGQNNYAPFNDRDALKKQLLTLFEQFKKGKLSGVKMTDIEHFSRKKLTENILNIFESITSDLPSVV